MKQDGKWRKCRLLSVHGTIATVVCDGKTIQVTQVAFDNLKKFVANKVGKSGEPYLSEHSKASQTLPPPRH